MKIGFFSIVGGVVVAICAAIAVVGLVIYYVFFSGSEPSKGATAPAAIQSTTPAAAPVQIRYPDVKGLCFRTPMGDVGKVMEQENDRLDMSFRGGPRATYLYDQVVHADCGVLPKG
jgi:hypothetical protein